MEPKEPVAQPQQSSSDIQADQLENQPNGIDKSAREVDSYVITREVLRSLIDERIDKKSKSWFHTISNNALIVVVVGGAITAAITHRYSLKQQELQFQHSVELQKLSRLDDLNKIRIQKVAEVLEQLAKDERAIDRLLDNTLTEGQTKTGPDKTADEIRRLVDNDQAVASQNRFWLGEKGYTSVSEYLNKSIDLALNKLVLPPEKDFGEMINKREAAKQKVLQTLYLDSLFWEGQTEANVNK